MHARLVSPFGLVATCLLALCEACSGSPSVNDLYAFASTKDVKVQVSVKLVAGNGGQAVDPAQPGRYLLRASAADGSDVEVPLGYLGHTPVTPLPVTLTGSELSFPAIAAVPAQMQAGAAGYALRFRLDTEVDPARGGQTAVAATGASRRRAAGRDTEVIDNTRLEAVLGGVVAGTAPEANPVELSLASTLAVQLLVGQGVALQNDDALSAYGKMTALFAERQKTLELDVVAGARVSPGVFSQIMFAALQKEAVSDVAFQASLAAIGNVAGSAAAVQGLTSTLGAWTQAASVVFVPDSSVATKLFTSTFTAQAITSIQVAKTTPVVSYAPKSLAFTDTDPAATIGGEVVVAAGSVVTGVSGYAIYIGGDTPERARLSRLGVAPMGGGRVSLAVAAGTVVPAGGTRLWAFPLVAGAEISGSVSAPLVNALKLSLPPPAIIAARGGDASATLTWVATPGATTTLLRGTALPLNPADCSAVPSVTSPFVDTGLTNGTTYFYALASQEDGQTGPWSEPVAATPQAPLAPPEGLGRDAADAAVTVSWSPNPQATGYRLYRTTAQPATIADANVFDNVVSPFIDTGLVNGTHYYYALEVLHGDTAGGIGGFLPALPYAGANQLPPVVWMTNEKHPVCNWTAVPNAVNYNVYIDGPGLATAQSTMFSSPDLSMPLDSQSGISSCAVAAVYLSGSAGPLSEPARIDLDMPAFASGTDATHVFGQGAFNNINYNPGGAIMQGPALGIAVSTAGKLYLSDGGSKRVMGFNAVPAADGPALDFALGQANTADVAVAGGTAPTQFNLPTSVAADNEVLWVADRPLDGETSRVVGFSPLPGGNQPAASIVLGAPDFGWPSQPATATDRTFLGAAGIAASSGRLVVCDSKANRVLLYSRRPKYNNTPADIVLGQNDFIGHAVSASIDASTLSNPASAWTDGGRLLVYDAGHNRVLLWQSWPTRNNQPADFVFGQSDMYQGAPNAGGNAVSAAGVSSSDQAPDCQPGVYSNGQLMAIADPGNQRVLILNEFFSTNGIQASIAVGQANLTASVASPPRRNSMLSPQTVYLDGRYLIVGDVGNERYLMFDGMPP